MQDPPERIWATEDRANFGEDRFHSTSPMKGLTEYTRTDLCITEAECQRRIDTDVAAEREACAKTANRITLIGNSPMEQHASLETACTIRDAIRARGQK